MRVLALIIGLAGLASSGALAQDLASLSVDDQTSPGYQARWNACYKETRLIYRTRNLSEEQYRVVVKDARRAHMQTCMARAQPPRPLTVPDAAEKMPKSSIAGWASNP